jgi:hypothetical protein
MKELVERPFSPLTPFHWSLPQMCQGEKREPWEPIPTTFIAMFNIYCYVRAYGGQPHPY